MNLTNPIFHNEDLAREYLEAQRWPNGPFCPHCGESENVIRMVGSAHRPGLLNCRSCRKQFSVTVGTVFERSKIALHKWLLAAHLLSASKKGYSSHQLHRTLGVTYKTAWFMTHRLREAMREESPAPIGGGGKTVEVDETFIGRDKTIKPKGEKKGRGYHHKQKVLALVERGGKVRSTHVPAVNAATLRPILNEQLAEGSKVYTDEAGQYVQVKPAMFENHDYVKHGIGEYVRGDVHTNTIEGYFSIFKRGMNGIYQHCSEQHLKRYLCEYDFRYNHRIALDFDDEMRAAALLKGIEGKRLTYRRTHGQDPD